MHNLKTTPSYNYVKTLEADQKEIFIFVQFSWASPEGQFFDSVIRSHSIDPLNGCLLHTYSGHQSEFSPLEETRKV